MHLNGPFDPPGSSQTKRWNDATDGPHRKADKKDAESNEEYIQGLEGLRSVIKHSKRCR